MALAVLHLTGCVWPRTFFSASTDFDLATERLCLQRPPDDQEERCAETLYQNRRVYMCFCRGDLCNGAHTVTAAGTSTIALVFATTAVAHYVMRTGL